METIKQIFSGNAKDGEESEGFLSEDEDVLFQDALIDDAGSAGSTAYCTVTAPRPGVKGMIYVHPDPAAKQAKRTKRNPRNTVIHKSTYSAIVKDMVGPDLNIRADAMRILHQEGERYLQGVFGDAQVLCNLNGRKTVGLQDLRGVQALAARSFVEKKAILQRDPAFGENLEPQNL